MLWSRAQEARAGVRAVKGVTIEAKAVAQETANVMMAARAPSSASAVANLCAGVAAMSA